MVKPLRVKLRPYREVVLGKPKRKHGIKKKPLALQYGCMTTCAFPWPQHPWLTALSMPHLPAVHTRPYPSFWGRGYNSAQATVTLIGALAFVLSMIMSTFFLMKRIICSHDNIIWLQQFSFIRPTYPASLSFLSLPTSSTHLSAFSDIIKP